MRVQSFIRDGQKLQPVEVELTLWPGLPGIHFLGLPDQHLKESALRIKSAIKHQGFQFPSSQQILVNLRPSHLKKNSRGLELAVAAAFLWETEQVAKPIVDSRAYIYGELSLTGEVIAPSDLKTDWQDLNSVVWSGAVDGSGFRTFQMKTLQDLQSPTICEADSNLYNWKRPELSEDILLSETHAKCLAIIASGGHSALLAGPAGSGKTTMAELVHKLLPPPSGQIPLQNNWYNFVRPHHSTPLMAMIGGGGNFFQGEITRANNGVLLLDEFLEFDPKVIEALREPIEEGVIRVARLGRFTEYPAKTHVIATTNLCPCGDWTPERKKGCRFTINRCKSHLQRLTGPMMDRFHVLHFMQVQEERKTNLQEVIEKIELANQTRKNRKQTQTNARLSISDLEKCFDPLELSIAFPYTGRSLRRRWATMRVARTLADIEGCKTAQARHIQEALFWSFFPFEDIKKWD